MASHQIRHRHFARCAFCQSKPDSKEHAWENWTVGRLRTDDSGIIGHFEGEEVLAPSQKAVRIKCLCDGCNRGWVKSLNEEVQPFVASMITDLSIPLDDSQQAVPRPDRARVTVPFGIIPTPLERPLRQNCFAKLAARSATRTGGRTNVCATSRTSSLSPVHVYASRDGADSAAPKPRARAGGPLGPDQVQLLEVTVGKPSRPSGEHLSRRSRVPTCAGTDSPRRRE